jgi:hypothetical protein
VLTSSCFSCFCLFHALFCVPCSVILTDSLRANTTMPDKRNTAPTRFTTIEMSSLLYVYCCFVMSSFLSNVIIISQT